VGILVDYAGARLEHCDVRVLRLVIDTWQGRYPNRVEYFMICNRPPFFARVWDALSPYVDPWIMAKMHVLVEEQVS
jgi:hypothetical protein